MTIFVPLSYLFFSYLTSDLGTHLLSAGGDRVIHLWNPFKVSDEKEEVVVSGVASESHVCSFKGAHAYDVLQLDVYVLSIVSAKPATSTKHWVCSNLSFFSFKLIFFSFFCASFYPATFAGRATVDVFSQPEATASDSYGTLKLKKLFRA